jgi:hypothetical protein
MFIFDAFRQMINDLPPEAVLKALDLQCKMLEHDLEAGRLSASEAALSIVSFRQFVRTVKVGHAMHCVKPLPPEHIEFFKGLIVRLVKAKELPPDAMEQFDFTFLSSFGGH